MASANIIERNGYKIKSVYQGVMTYVVYKDGQEVYCCWSMTQLQEFLGFDPFSHDEY